MNTKGLFAAVKAVCPVESISYGKRDDKSTWRLDFLPQATAEQRAAARAVVAAFDINAPPPAPPPTKTEKALALLVQKGVLTQAEVDAL